MGKYTNIDEAIFTVFATAAWLERKIPTYVTNVPANKNDTQFLRLNIIPSGKGVNIRSASGVLIIEIFVLRDRGTPPISKLADALDAHLLGQSRPVSDGNVQFFSSNLGNGGPDSANPALYRADYSINFNYNEV